MSTTTEQKYVFLRYDRGGPDDPVPYRMDEARARLLIGASIRNVDKAIASLKRGKDVRTAYATYRAELVK